MADKYEYSTIGEICTRMKWGRKKFMNMIKKEGFPAVRVGRDYITTETKIREWINLKLSCQ